MQQGDVKEDPRPLVLVIDDDEGDRFHIQRCIRQSGVDCIVLEAEDIDPALAEHGDKTVDVVLLDYNLPGGTGLTGIPLIHERWQGSAVVLTTGEGSDVIVAEAFRTGVRDYISKLDISARSIRRVIENAVEARRLEMRIAAQQQELKMFAHVLAHDVRAPLRAIRQLGEFAVESLSEGDTAATLSELEDIRSSAERLDNLVESLERHLKVRGASQFAMEDAADLARDAAANLRVEIQDRGAEVIIETLPEVMADRRQIIQLFQNLIANGLKFSRADLPRVTITAPKIGGDMHTICVADNGIGIAPEHAERIFEPFQRLHTQEDFAGSGLGLATCRKIVSRHGGQIWCALDDRPGTRFHFSLPRADAKSQAPALGSDERRVISKAS